ncbi:MAG: sigma-70 family RNA polymerase sigma factor [Nannocystaceae bacterium]
MSYDEFELYSAWRAGNRKSGSILVERYYDSVVRFFRTKVAPSAADDLVQRTFMVCADSETAFRGEGKFKSYLFGVARRTLLSHFNSKHRQREDPDFGISSAFDLAPGPVTVAAGRADQRWLVEALRSIPVEMQITLELFYWQGLAIDELSVALEIPPGTVKSRLHRGRTLLRHAMEKIPVPDGLTRSVTVLMDEWAAGVHALVPESR